MNYLSSKYGYKQVDFPDWQKYHECIIKGTEAEKEGDFKAAAESYELANKIRPGNNELQYRILWCNANKVGFINPAIETLDALKGQYGPVRILIENAKIKINVGGKTRELKYAGEDIFLDEKVILKFDRSLRPVTLACFFPWGGKCEDTQAIIEAKESLSTTAHIAESLSIPVEKALSGLLDKDTAIAIEAKLSSSAQLSTADDNPIEDLEISDEDMTRSAFGQGSSTAQDIVRKPK